MLNYLQKDIEITNYSNFKTKAFSKYFFEIKTKDDVFKLKEIREFCKNNNLDLLFIWWGTNLLFAFDNYNGVVIKNSLTWWNYDKSSQILHTYSNERISDVAQNLENNYWQYLWHRFIWLPWSIWGAIFWNAGCFWLETENNFLDSEIYNIETWQIKIFNKNEMSFSYRNSILKELNNKYFVISARFDLSKKIEKYHSDVDNLDFRENKQPKWNTCWSFFKNPSKEFSAWFLIESVWLKWYKIWGAFFSPIHANFLMHDGNWTYNNLLELIDLAIEKVYNQYQIKLSPEVRIIFNK